MRIFCARVHDLAGSEEDLSVVVRMRPCVTVAGSVTLAESTVTECALTVFEETVSVVVVADFAHACPANNPTRASSSRAYSTLRAVCEAKEEYLRGWRLDGRFELSSFEF